jgi:hypothetical protein
MYYLRAGMTVGASGRVAFELWRGVADGCSAPRMILPSSEPPR